MENNSSQLAIIPINEVKLQPTFYERYFLDLDRHFVRRVAYKIPWIGIVASVVLYLLGHIISTSNLLVHRATFLGCPILHILSCWFLFAGLSSKSYHLYKVYVLLNALFMSFSLAFPIVLLIDGFLFPKWIPINLFAALIHCFLVPFLYYANFIVCKNVDLVQVDILDNMKSEIYTKSHNMV